MFKPLLVVCFMFCCVDAFSQELYVFTEPASNMPANSISARLNTSVSKMNHSNKWTCWSVNPEVMFGVNRKFMFHLQGFSSNMFQSNIRLEGGGIYGKYRLYSADDIHRHFRVASYARFTLVNNPVVLKARHAHALPDGNGGTVIHDIDSTYRDYKIQLDGEVSGLGTGVIATQLLNRLALSASAGYLYRLNNIGTKKELNQPWHAVNWSLSAGYLFLPKVYTDYRQTNVNLYLELLGYNSIDGIGSHIDAAPAIQFIFNSVARLDLGYTHQLTGKGERFSNSSFILKLEYNFLNVFKTK